MQEGEHSEEIIGDTVKQEDNPLITESTSLVEGSEIEIETAASLLKKLLKHTIPIVLDNLIVASTDFGNAIIITKIGGSAVAANAYIGTIKNLFLSPTGAIFYSLQPILSKEFAKHNQGEFNEILKSSLLLVVPISIATAAILIPISSLLKLLGQDELLSDITADYFRYYVGSLPASLIIQNLLQVFLSTNNQILLIPTSILRTTLELGLGFTFVYGFEMGMTGWKLSTLLQPWISLIFILLGLKLTNRFDFSSMFKINLNQHGPKERICNILGKQLEILRLGVPVGGQIFLELAARFTNTLILGRQSQYALIAYNISGQWTYWIVNLHASISTSAAVLVANLRAKGKLAELKKVGNISLAIGFSISTAALITYSALSRPLTSVLLDKDSNYEAIADFSKIILPIASVSTLSFGFKYISSGIARGYEKTTAPMLWDFAGSVAIGLTLAILLVFAFDWDDPYAVVVAELIGSIFASLGTTIYAHKLSESRAIVDAQDNYTENSNFDDNCPSLVETKDDYSDRTKERNGINPAAVICSFFCRKRLRSSIVPASQQSLVANLSSPENENVGNKNDFGMRQ